jgi:membrane-associated phospholipid phosphatase
VYSTLTVKQHVVLDLLGGAALALALVWLSLQWRPRPA